MSERKWTAAEVKGKLRGRHPATQQMGVRTIPGPWTCIEEWAGIDLLALCATSAGRVRDALVGYEVKVSRSDYRNEIRRPEKRAHAVSMCHEFYFAVPRGLLRDEEIAARPSVIAEQDELPGVAEASGSQPLYVPDDVGLVVVDGRGCQVVKRAPLNHGARGLNGGLRGDGHGSGLHNLIRWVSARPDPRHNGVVERARERSQEITALERRSRENERQYLAQFRDEDVA